MARQMDRMMDRHTKQWADRPMNGWTCNVYRYAINNHFPIDFTTLQKHYGWTD